MLLSLWLVVLFSVMEPCWSLWAALRQTKLCQVFSATLTSFLGLHPSHTTGRRWLFISKVVWLLGLIFTQEKHSQDRVFLSSQEAKEHLHSFRYMQVAELLFWLMMTRGFIQLHEYEYLVSSKMLLGFQEGW